MFKINLKNSEKGFSLLEILIYASVFVVVAGSITGILVNVLNVTSQQQASSEVDENLRQVIAIMGDKIRQSSLIETATNTNLILKAADFSTTTFSVVDDILYLTEGENNPVSLLSNKIKVDSLNFQKIEQPGARGGVRVNISLIYDDPKPNLSISKSLVSTINRAAAISFGEDILPSINNLYSVGADNPRWLNGYFSGNVDVDGNLDATQLCIAGDCKNAWSAIGNLVGTGTINYLPKWASTSTLENSLIYDNGTNIGIGTTTVDSLLHIAKTNGDAIISIEQSGDEYSSGIDFIRERTTGPGVCGGSIFMDSDVSTINANLYIQSQSAGICSGVTGDLVDGNGARIILGTGKIDINEGDLVVNSDNLFVDVSSGYTGIGTASPSEKLDVIGNVELTGTIIPDNSCGISGAVLQYHGDSPGSGLVGGALGLTPAAENLHYGTTMVCPGTVNAISINCSKRLGGSISVEVGKNGVGQSCDVTGTVANTGYSTTGCSVSFSAGDEIGCYLKSYDAITDYIRFCECAIFVRFN